MNLPYRRLYTIKHFVIVLLKCIQQIFNVNIIFLLLISYSSDWRLLNLTKICYKQIVIINKWFDFLLTNFQKIVDKLLKNCWIIVEELLNFFILLSFYQHDFKNILHFFWKRIISFSTSISIKIMRIFYYYYFVFNV